MANRMQGEVEIALDRRRILKVNHRARRAYEEASRDHQTLNQFFDAFRVILERYPPVIGPDGQLTMSGEAMGELLRDVSISKVALVLWACLEWEDRLLSVDRAVDLIDLAPGGTDDAKLLHVLGKIQEAYNAARGIDPEAVKRRVAELRAKKEEEGPPSPPEPRGGGDPSSSSPRSGSDSPTPTSGA